MENLVQQFNFFRVQVFQNNKIFLVFLFLEKQDLYHLFLATPLPPNSAGSKFPARPAKRVPRKPPCFEICNLDSFKVTAAPFAFAKFTLLICYFFNQENVFHIIG